MKITKAFAAALFATTAASSYAYEPVLGPLDGVSRSIGNTFAALSSASPPSIPFTNTYSFSLSLLNLVEVNFFGSNLSSVSVSLTGGSPSFASLTDPNPSDGYQFAFGELSPGNYDLTVAGDVGSKGGAYGGVVQATTVPEPEVYALLLVGLGATAFVARRRKPR